MSVSLSHGVVLIRPLQLTDSDAMHAAVIESMEELLHWLPWAHRKYGPVDATSFIEMNLRWWENQSEFPFGIFDATDGSYIGNVGVNHIVRPHRYANLGYWVRTSRTRQGLAARATRLAARYGFETVGLTRIEIVANPDNLGSRRVAEKAGARLEAIVRNRIVMHGRPLPAVLYSLVPEDLSALLSSPPPPSSPGTQ